MKALMAVSGLIMILYLLAHMFGNLKIFAGQAAFDGYSHWLRTMGHPVFPYSGALWIIRVVLIASVLAHVISAITLWLKDRNARGGTKRYLSSKGKRGVQRTYASFTLRWGGIVILLFVVYHLLHLTANVIAPGGASASPYQRLVNGFGIWWVVASYTIAMLAVGLHIRHGFWSALASLGANRSAKTRRVYSWLALAIAVLITVGFLIPPFSVLFGLVK